MRLVGRDLHPPLDHVRDELVTVSDLLHRAAEDTSPHAPALRGLLEAMPIAATLDEVEAALEYGLERVRRER
jgi:hypothetical protein